MWLLFHGLLKTLCSFYHQVDFSLNSFPYAKNFEKNVTKLLKLDSTNFQLHFCQIICCRLKIYIFFILVIIFCLPFRFQARYSENLPDRNHSFQNILLGFLRERHKSGNQADSFLLIRQLFVISVLLFRTAIRKLCFTVFLLVGAISIQHIKFRYRIQISLIEFIVAGYH